MIKDFIDFNKLKDRAYEIAQKHGWHDNELSVYHYQMLIITEISEAVNADRMKRYAEGEPFEKICVWWMREFHVDKSDELFEKYIKDTVEDELSDVVIRCLDLAGMLELDLSDMNQLNRIIEKLAPQLKIYADMTFTEWSLATVRVLIGLSEDQSVERLKTCILSCFIKSDMMNFDLLKHVEYKMKYNEHRPYKHGKLY